MKKIVTVALCCALLVSYLCVFVACLFIPDIGNTDETPAPTNEHTHTYEDDWSSDEVYHWHATTCGHTSVQGDKEKHVFNELDVCEVCGRSHIHSWTETLQVEANVHYVRCGVCGESEWQVHNYVIYERRSDSHLSLCICGDGNEGEHVYGDDGVCVDCGAMNHNHVFTQYAPSQLDFDLHLIVCECGVMDRYEQHLFPFGNVCEMCGATRHDHTWYYMDERDELFHSLQCSSCKRISAEEHDGGKNASCSVCGYKTHEHKWVVVDSASVDEHNVQCSVCGLTNLQEHDFSKGDTCVQCGTAKHYHKWLWDNTSYVNIHGLYCDTCGGIGWSEHLFEEGSDVCYVCGAPRHTHNWEFNEYCTVNNAQHQLYCPDCGEGKWQNHVYGKDGTCTWCGHVM